MEVGGHSKQKCKKLRLIEAITTGRLYQTKMILADSPNVNFVDEQGLSPLMRAFMIEDEKHRTRITMVKLLLQHNAEVNLRDMEGRHALSLACRTNKLDLVKLMLEKCLHDIDLTSQDLEGNTPLMYAVMNNNALVVRLLVNAMRKFSLSVDQRNREDKTPYLKAVEMGFQECADILSEVGKASQSIKVNPFLDFLVIECRDNVRVSSAPVVKACVNAGSVVGRKHVVVPRRKNGCATVFRDGNRKIFPNKKRNRLLKSRKVHSEGSYSQKNQTVRKSAPKDAGKVEIENVKGTGKTATKVADKVTIFVEEPKRKKSDVSSGDGKDDKNPREGKHSPTNGQDRLLWLILDGSASETANERRSKSPGSCHSTNPRSRSISPANNTSPRCIVPSLNNFLDRQEVPRNNVRSSHSVISRFQESPRDFENNSIKSNSGYYAYLEWKASVHDQSPNSLRNLLALRAEQQSGLSSYRKGLVLRKYEPETDEVGEDGEDRSAGVASPISERSSRSEAVRKITAVARTIGLSVYLSNKRKISNKKGP